MQLGDERFHQKGERRAHRLGQIHRILGRGHVGNLHPQAIAFGLVPKKRRSVKKVDELQIVQRGHRPGMPGHGVGREAVHRARGIARAINRIDRDDHVVALHVGKHVQAHAADIVKPHVFRDLVIAQHGIVHSRPHSLIEHKPVPHAENGGFLLPHTFTPPIPDG